MYKTRDECLIALMKDNDVLQQSKVVYILCRPATGAYHYILHVPGRTPRFGQGESMEMLYGTLEPSVENGWLFCPFSDDAKEDLEKNPVPGKLMIGSRS